MSRPAPRFKDALDVLARHGVDFIVVGGVAAVLAILRRTLEEATK